VPAGGDEFVEYFPDHCLIEFLPVPRGE
jgi:hypothetical protein